jgi:exopolysaccharide production protein ExoQ
MNAEGTFEHAVSFERSGTRGLAFALGFFFSFRLSIVMISVRLLGVEPGTGSALILGLDLMLLGIICFSSFGNQQQSVGSVLGFPAVRWALLYIAFAGLSLTWSESASLPHSIAYWLGLVVDVVNVVLLLRGESAQDNAEAMLGGFIWSSCFLALAAWLMPVQADLRLGDEQFFNTNEIGSLCAMALFFAQYLTRRNHVPWRFAKFLLFVTLIRSLSKGTIIAFLVSQAFLLVMDRSMRRKTKVLLLSSALLLLCIFWGLFEAYYDVYTTTGNQAETFTGRTAIWLYVLGATFDHPWTLWVGHGFDSWWKVVPPFGNELFEARHAENEFLQQFYALGVAGVALLMAIYGSLLRQLRKLQRGPTRVLLLSILIFVLVRGLAVADAFDLLLPLWSIILLSVVVNREIADNRIVIAPEIVIPL